MPRLHSPMNLRGLLLRPGSPEEKLEWRGRGDGGREEDLEKGQRDQRPPGGRVWRAVYFLKVNLLNGYLANTLWNKAMKLG